MGEVPWCSFVDFLGEFTELVTNDDFRAIHMCSHFIVLVVLACIYRYAYFRDSTIEREKQSGGTKLYGTYPRPWYWYFKPIIVIK